MNASACEGVLRRALRTCRCGENDICSSILKAHELDLLWAVGKEKLTGCGGERDRHDNLISHAVEKDRRMN